MSRTITYIVAITTSDAHEVPNGYSGVAVANALGHTLPSTVVTARVLPTDAVRCGYCGYDRPGTEGSDAGPPSPLNPAVNRTLEFYVNAMLKHGWRADELTNGEYGASMIEAAVDWIEAHPRATSYEAQA